MKTLTLVLDVDASRVASGLKSGEQRLQQFEKTAADTTGKFDGHMHTGAKAGGRFGASLDATSLKAGALGGAVALAADKVGTAAIQIVRDSIGAASALQEQISATKTLFGDAADEMLEFGESAAAIGLSERAALQAGNAFGDLFTKIGYSTEASQTFSEDLVRMAADFASFKDLAPEDVLGKLKSGLSGESEPLRPLGVFLTEAKVQAEGARMGLAGTHGELDEGSKIVARYSLIMKEMGKAQGDVARTGDSYANAQRRANAEWENLKATIGSGLLPIMADLANILGDVADKVDGAAPDSDGGSWVDSVPLVNNVAHALDWLAGESDEASDSTDYLADSQKALAEQQSRTRRNVELTTEQIEEQKKALDDLLLATQAQFGAELDYQRAILGLSGDIEEYNESLRRNKDGKADNDVSARELAEQELGLRDALLQAGEAAVRQADEQAAAAGKTLTESQKYDIFREALLQLKEQFPQLGSRIDEYVARLDKIPASKRTEAGLVGVELAMARATALREALAKLPAFKRVTVRYDEVLGATVQRGAMPGRVIERAGGGPVTGPGTTTSDSILAALSNGEYVQQAAAVDKYGLRFMDDVNNLRYPVPGYAAGGLAGDLRYAAGAPATIAVTAGAAGSWCPAAAPRGPGGAARTQRLPRSGRAGRPGAGQRGRHRRGGRVPGPAREAVMAARRYANGTATSLSVPAAPAATRAGAVRLHPADLQALGEVVAASAGGVTINAQSGASAQELMVEAGWLLSTRRLR